MKQTIEMIAKDSGFSLSKLGVRFDRVAQRLMDKLILTSERAIPAGSTLLIGIAAPIRLPAKTAIALEEKIAHLSKDDGEIEPLKLVIHKNIVQIRILKNLSPKSPKIVAFVHNPTTRPQRLFAMTEAWLSKIPPPF